MSGRPGAEYELWDCAGRGRRAQGDQGPGRVEHVAVVTGAAAETSVGILARSQRGEERRRIPPREGNGNDAACEVLSVVFSLGRDCVGEVGGKRGECLEGLRRLGAILERGGDRGTVVRQRAVQLNLVLQPQQSARNFRC